MRAYVLVQTSVGSSTAWSKKSADAGPPSLAPVRDRLLDERPVLHVLQQPAHAGNDLAGTAVRLHDIVERVGEIRKVRGSILQHSARRLGIRRAELSLVHGDNRRVRHVIEAFGGKVVKTYRLYEKVIATSAPASGGRQPPDRSTGSGG